jgi:putative oxidoreductase
MDRYSDEVLLAGRIALGAIFVLSGFNKLMGVDAFAASLATRGVPMSSILAPLGAGVEFVGGLAIVLGFQVRYAAALMILFTIVATLISHRFWEFTGPARVMQQSQFMKNLAIIGGFIVLIAAGSGRFAITKPRIRRDNEGASSRR